MQCSSVQGICICALMMRVHLPALSLYKYMQCGSMQGLCS